MKNTGFSEITMERVNYDGTDPWFLEIAITGKCNFKCKYCNRFSADFDESIYEVLKKFPKLRHIQVTGGEPTSHENYKEIIQNLRKYTQVLGLSSNGSRTAEEYLSLPVDMFSFSLDDSDLDILKKRGYRDPEKIIEVIRKVSSERYVNIGLVVDSLNVDRIESIIEYILDLGVSDIKLSVSTHNEVLPVFTKSYSEYPILSYRIQNFKQEKQMRGYPAKKCHIAKNDVCVVNDKHYPCLVYFREGGQAIGKTSEKMMEERVSWFEKTNCQVDPICSKFCMDFKCEFNREKEKKL